MSTQFDYFVVFAEMRTGSNFLEASLNEFSDIHCYGEAYNPHFISHHSQDALFGVDMAQREIAPLSLIERMKENTDGFPGFRFFNDHDPRVMAHVLADPKCAKIILTRNPLDSYVSLKIAAQTGQWKLGDMKQRRSATVTFDREEFEQHLAAKKAFQLDILKGMQISGQSGFYVAYEDISDVEIVNGMARFIGSHEQIDATPNSVKKQNPSGLEDKVTNYEQMVKDLSNTDHFALSDTPNFEPRRGPGVPGFYLAADAPVLFIPVAGAPKVSVLEWLAALDDAEVDQLQTKLSQKLLRQWKRGNPGHRSFTVIRHPLDRAHRVFCEYIVPKRDDNFSDPRRVMRNRYGVSVPGQGDLSGYTKMEHRAAFAKFLEFLKGNLAGQTSIRIDAVWATQSALLQGASGVVLPDIILRENDLEDGLPALAATLGLEADAPNPEPEQGPFSLADIYDKELEKLAVAVYRKDYINFGFGDWNEG
ncbi:nodulation protein NodH [uncultured Litoreibacter sp.]|uniref:nodulation protein NodH n=1 Tax=uncultured Litoreibacter sp. TaxID=1392394 RepID=UPI002639F78D|nr:nodulation protein NodH [uncultured Litoreibacter sp.]